MLTGQSHPGSISEVWLSLFRFLLEIYAAENDMNTWHIKLYINCPTFIWLMGNTSWSTRSGASASLIKGSFWERWTTWKCFADFLSMKGFLPIFVYRFDKEKEERGFPVLHNSTSSSPQRKKIKGGLLIYLDKLDWLVNEMIWNSLFDEPNKLNKLPLFPR